MARFASRMGCPFLRSRKEWGSSEVEKSKETGYGNVFRDMFWDHWLVPEQDEWDGVRRKSQVSKETVLKSTYVECGVKRLRDQVIRKGGA